QAFAAATFLAKEYGHKNILYSIGAYTVATGVAACRVLNNRHWLSDVIAGAGIGILSTNIVYATHQYKWGKSKKISKNNTLSVTPMYGSRATGLYLSYKF
ncbi:MAG TPA: phosphatase PAP2 family protein, partial [Cyclobacteriaceae bacterium]|nr:phosphatase PAP2 family protein [Cyclobacteriaceae bacterium]